MLEILSKGDLEYLISVMVNPLSFFGVQALG
jgi:hypothetical protein